MTKAVKCPEPKSSCGSRAASTPTGASHQCSTFADRRTLAHVGCDVANGEPDPRMLGAVPLGPVEQEHMVEGHLARRQLDVDHRCRIDGNGDLLPTGEHVRFVELVL